MDMGRKVDGGTKKRVRRSVVRRVRRKAFEKGVILDAMTQALKSGAEVKRLRAAFAEIASDEFLWDALAELEAVTTRLVKQGASRWGM